MIAIAAERIIDAISSRKDRFKLFFENWQHIPDTTMNVQRKNGCIAYTNISE
jgi:hypothetical protein